MKEYQEIERKYLILHPPEDYHLHKHKLIRQGYLSLPEDHSTLRVRQLEDKYFLTVKQKESQSTLVRKEVEIAIDEKTFQPLWEMSHPRHIEKTRYYLPWMGEIIELDFFHGNLEGLILAEVEFHNEKEAVDFPSPPWFGKELTDDFRYTNSSLSHRGLPK